MKKKKQIVKVEKLYLSSSEKPGDYPQLFPKMPILYLELIENKKKIQPKFINKQYSPDKNSPVITKKDEKLSPKSNTSDNTEKHSISDKHSVSDKYPVQDKSEKSDTPEKNNKTGKSVIEKKDDIDEQNEKPVQFERSDIEINEYKDSHIEHTDKYVENRDNEPDEHHSIDSNDSDAIGKRLQQLLSKTKNDDKEKDKYSRDIPNDNYYSKHGETAPSLADLEKQGVYRQKKTLEDINHIDTDDEDKKRELLFKFDILKKTYPNSSISEYSIHSDYNNMLKDYEQQVKRLSLDSSVETYKQYLIYGFMGVEFIFGNFLGFDMEGFTKQQIVSMNSYEKLLIELGQKSYVPESKWPVELRLIFLIIINAGVFIVSRIILNRTGSNLLGMINGLSNSTQNNNTAESSRKPTRHMKGPDINVNEL